MFGTMFKNIPDEVVDVIYTYLHELKYCLDDIKVKGCRSRMNQIVDGWVQVIKKDKYIEYMSYIHKNINDPEHIINQLSKCNCCSRHQSNRPTTLNDIRYLKFITNYNYDNMNQDIHECKCTCRHNCRRLFKINT